MIIFDILAHTSMQNSPYAIALLIVVNHQVKYPYYVKRILRHLLREPRWVLNKTPREIPEFFALVFQQKTYYNEVVHMYKSGANMEIVVDASVLIAVVANEEDKPRLVELTREAELIAPLSVHWEMGNAFSAMLKRQRITLDQAVAALEAYLQIPVRFVEVELIDSLMLADELNMYAYDAYLLRCAEKYRSPLLSLDKKLIQSAKSKKIAVLELPE
jgi:predicted nucleic acid-binding protein